MRMVRGVIVAALALAVPVLGAAQAGKPRVIEITGNDAMKFSLMKIQAKPGEQLLVRLKAVGTMPKIAMAHNFVLLTQKADAAKFAEAAAMARATNFIPPAMKDQVIAATPLAGNGETVEVTFKAPTAKGSYTYLCSFTGHFMAGMKGQLVVQ